MAKSIKELVDETLAEFHKLQELGDDVFELLPHEMQEYVESILNGEELSEDQAALFLGVVLHKVISNKI